MKREHKNQIRIAIFISLFIIVLQPNKIINGEGEVHDNTSVLILVDNDADYELASLIDLRNNLNVTIRDINQFSNLNQIFVTENYFDQYNSIVLLLNQIANPFNQSLQDELNYFISTGGLFGIVSAQIWKFSSTFHSLLGLEVPLEGQREYPQGNFSTDIELELDNHSFFESINPSSPVLSMEGCIGISWPIDQNKEVASIQTASGNATITAFPQNDGFSFAIPFSPVKVSLALENTSLLLENMIKAGLNSIEAITSSYPENSSTSENLLFLSLSLEPLASVVVVGSVIAFLSGFFLFVYNKLQNSSPKIDLKADKSFILTFIIGPLFAIGQIIYPPIVRRIDRYDVIENAYRSRILDILKEREFLHFRELKRELEIGTSSLKWHLQVLEDFRIIKRQVFGQYDIYYMYHKIPNPDFLNIYFAIVSGGGYRVAQAFSRVDSWDLGILAEYVEQSREGTKYHIKRFEDLKILKLEHKKYVLREDKKAFLKKALKRRKQSS